MKPIMQRRNTKPYDNTAEYPHLKRLYPADRSNGSFQHIFCDFSVCRDFSVYYKHTIDRYIHYEICDQSRQCRYFFLLFRHSDRYTYRENQRQIIEHRTSDLVHDRKKCMEYCTVSQYLLKSIRCNGCLIRKRTSNSQQQTCYRKNRDWKHKGSSDSL